jgi:hypothetical protein
MPSAFVKRRELNEKLEEAPHSLPSGIFHAEFGDVSCPYETQILNCSHFAILIFIYM